MFSVEPQGLAFVEHAPVRVDVSVALPTTSAPRAFETLTSVDAIVSWWKACRSACWTTPPPHHVGSERIMTFRTVTLHQRILASQPGVRWAATVTRSGLPFFRSYVTVVTFEPFDRRGTRVRWTAAIDETLLVGPARPALRRVVRHNAEEMLRNLHSHLEERRRR